MTVQVLCIGFLHQHRITPEEVTEDVVTAAQDGAENEELRKLAAELVESAKGLERLR